ncbi:MAG: hypothetical protein AAF623_04665 [Planctomycetota bacterium]
MKNLNRFMQDSFATPNNPSVEPNSFKSITDAQLAEHLQVNTYDEFQLTDAIRPALDLKIKPKQGYRHDVYVDEESSSRVPVVMASASRERLFPLFMNLIEKLGSVVDVVLESSHNQADEQHEDLYREHIDMPVLRSILYDFEDLLLNDGCTGIAVLNPNTPQEIQFEEHKLLVIYGSPLEHYEFALEKFGVSQDEEIRFISEAEHMHSSTEEYAERFFQLRAALGLDGSQAGEQEKPYEDQFGDRDDGEDFGGIC